MDEGEGVLGVLRQSAIPESKASSRSVSSAATGGVSLAAM